MNTPAEERTRAIREQVEHRIDIAARHLDAIDAKINTGDQDRIPQHVAMVRIQIRRVNELIGIPS